MVMREKAATKATTKARQVRSRRPEKVSRWLSVSVGWGWATGSVESVYTLPGRPTAWRRADADLDARCDAIDQDADRRVQDVVRQRALGGDYRAQNLAFRTTRGFARPVDLTPRVREAEAIPPEVAAAMIAAGLAALDPD